MAPPPNAKRKRRNLPPAAARLHKPHPDDEEQVRAAFDAVERGDVLSADESAAYLGDLLGDEPAQK